jgi:hypothetical protein
MACSASAVAVSCFCPGSAHGRHLMGSDEEEVGQSRRAQSSCELLPS